MSEYEFDQSTPVTVSLRMHRGLAEIIAADTPSIQVRVTPMDGNDSGREAAEKMRVSLEGDTLVVHSWDQVAWSLRRSPKVRVAIRVPAGSSLSAKAASADVRAAGDYGVVQTDLASGDAYVERVAGDAELKTASGDVRIDHVGGGLRANSASGDIRIGDVIGDVILSAASGDITAGTIGGSLRSKTASGDVEIGRVRTGTTHISSASGDVKVGVAAGTGVWLDVNTASGSTRSDLTMTGDAPATDQQATLELRIHTASGDITIHRVAAPPTPAPAAAPAPAPTAASTASPTPAPTAAPALAQTAASTASPTPAPPAAPAPAPTAAFRSAPTESETL